MREVTHKEIAERLHLYQESVTSALGGLRKAGIIAIGTNAFESWIEPAWNASRE